MCCCKYLDNQTSCPSRQAPVRRRGSPSDADVCGGRGEHPSPYKCCLPYLRLPLSGTDCNVHRTEPMDLIYAEYALITHAEYVQHMLFWSWTMQSISYFKNLTHITLKNSNLTSEMIIFLCLHLVETHWPLFCSAVPPSQLHRVYVSRGYTPIKCHKKKQYYYLPNIVSPVLRKMQIPGHKKSLKRRCRDPRMCWQLAGRLCAMHAQIRLRLCLRVSSQLQA